MTQDLIFTIGTLVFIIALIPTVIGKNKPAVATSVMTFIVLFVFGITYYSLHLYISALLTFVNALIWFFLAFQVLTRKK